MHRRQMKTLVPLCALATALAVGATTATAATPRILSLSVAPTKVKQKKSVTVTWELSKRANTSFQVARCLNKKCTSRTPVGSAIKRQGAVGLNEFKLAMRVRPGHYAVVASAGSSTRKARLKVVR